MPLAIIFKRIWQDTHDGELRKYLDWYRAKQSHSVPQSNVTASDEKEPIKKTPSRATREPFKHVLKDIERAEREIEFLGKLLNDVERLKENLRQEIKDGLVQAAIDERLLLQAQLVALKQAQEDEDLLITLLV